MIHARAADGVSGRDTDGCRVTGRQAEGKEGSTDMQHRYFGMLAAGIGTGDDGRSGRRRVHAQGRAQDRADHLLAEERRRLVAGARRGPPEAREGDGRADSRSSRTCRRTRPRSVRQSSSSSTAATTSSSAPPSAIPTPSRSCRRSIRRSPSSIRPASPTGRT